MLLNRWRLLVQNSRIRCFSTAQSTGQQQQQQSGSRFSWAPVFFAGTATFTFMLGNWQLRRAQWKEQVIEQRVDRLCEDPVPLQALWGTSPTELKPDSLFRRVWVSGLLDYSRQMLIGPRPAPTNTSTHGEHGYYIFTPLKLEEAGRYILVNRGWIRASDRGKPNIESQHTEASQPVEFMTVIREEEERPRYSSYAPPRLLADDPNLSANSLSTLADGGELIKPLGFVDVEGMCSVSGIDTIQAGGRAVYLDAVAPTNRDTPARKVIKDYQTFKLQPKDHRTYAATWYTLSVILLMMTAGKYGPAIFRRTKPGQLGKT